MTRKKKWYYVMVMTNKGPVYVTGTDNATKVAYWNCSEKPMAMTKDYAEQMALGLAVNGYNAVACWFLYEHEYQPYNYDKYEISFERKGTDEQYS